jgi:hypothetical protein
VTESSIPNKQLFSHGIVEAKRFRRTLTAVINGKAVPQAVREGLVVADEEQQQDQEEEEEADDGESLFLPEKKPISANPFANASGQTSANPFAKASTPAFNPQAPSFAPGTGMFQPPQATPFGQAETSANPLAKPSSTFMAPTQSGQDSINPLANPTNAFPTTTQPKVDSPTTAAKTANPFSKSGTFSFTPQSTSPKPTSQPFVFGSSFNTSTTVAPVNTATPATSTPFSFFSSQPTSTPATPAQPPAFSSPQWQNTQNTGTSRSIALFYSRMVAPRMSAQDSIYCLLRATSNLVIAHQFCRRRNSSLALPISLNNFLTLATCTILSPELVSSYIILILFIERASSYHILLPSTIELVSSSQHAALQFNHPTPGPVLRWHSAIGTQQPEAASQSTQNITNDDVDCRTWKYTCVLPSDGQDY